MDRAAKVFALVAVVIVVAASLVVLAYSLLADVGR
jgi:hypothetical protein